KQGANEVSDRGSQSPPPASLSCERPSLVFPYDDDRMVRRVATRWYASPNTLANDGSCVSPITTRSWLAAA
ncbi:hypothetical protein, partial [Halogeometricum sp. CBA1124]|uniref:hypothetical protein n=1 Tax=Halogeometricum sp. CBA1124 TaxID=2668071 RepID=UPI001E3F73D3